MAIQGSLLLLQTNLPEELFGQVVTFQGCLEKVLPVSGIYNAVRQ